LTPSRPQRRYQLLIRGSWPSLCATDEPLMQVIIDLEVPQMVFGRVCLIGDATHRRSRAPGFPRISTVRTLKEGRADDASTARLWSSSRVTARVTAGGA
jgi:hypothetical protein